MKPSKLLKILGQNVRNKRLEHQITQEKLSEELDIHRNTIILIEQGKRWVSAKMLENLANFFKCPAHELLKQNDQK